MHLLISLLLGLCALGIAILSVQNAAAVSVRFLVFQSIAMPVGVVLAFAFLGGLLLAALLPALWQLSAPAEATPEEIGDQDWG